MVERTSKWLALCVEVQEHIPEADVVVRPEQAGEHRFFFIVAGFVRHPARKAELHVVLPTAPVLVEKLAAESRSGLWVLELVGGRATPAARGVSRLLAGRFRLAPAGPKQGGHEKGTVPRS